MSTNDTIHGYIWKSDGILLQHAFDICILYLEERHEILRYDYVSAL